jgi:diguanylate cyclase (GGDEF)-like protein
MPRLDGYELIERIRASKVARIRNMPVIMISGDEGEAARKRAKSLGATDFITKGTETAELLARLDALVRLSPPYDGTGKSGSDDAIDAITGLPQRLFLLHRAEHVLSRLSHYGGHAGILVIGLDGLEQSMALVPGQASNVLLAKFAQVLAGIVPREDCLSRWSQNWFAVVKPGFDPAQTHRFAEQIRQAVAASKIDYQGRALSITVTIGVTTCPEDGAPDAKRLLILAEQRMMAARAAGGDCVVGAIARTETGSIMSVDEALDLIATGRVTSVRPGLREFATRLLPLLRLIGVDLAAEAAVAEIERGLKRKDEGHA